VELELCHSTSCSGTPTIIEEVTPTVEDDDERSNAESSTAEELDLMMMKYFSKGSFVDDSGASLHNVGKNIDETIARIEQASSTVGQEEKDEDEHDDEHDDDVYDEQLRSSSSLSAGITRHTISVNQLYSKPSSSSDELLKSASQPLESFAARLPSVFPYISPTPSMELLTTPVSTILTTPQPSRQTNKQALNNALEAPASAGYGVSVWMAALRRDAAKKQQEQEQKKQESSSSASDASSLDSDEELEQWALQIRSEIRQTEMMELAMEAEKAAELGHERFSCHPSTYGSMEEQDPAEDKIEAAQSFPCCPTKQASSKTLGSLSEHAPSNGLRRLRLRRHHTYSVGERRVASSSTTSSSPFQTTPSSIVVTPRLGSRTKKRLRVMALRNIDEVIPSMENLHMHLQTHLHLAGVDTSSIDPSLLTPYDGTSSPSPKSPQDTRSPVGSNTSDGSMSRIGFLKKFAGWVSTTASKDSGIVETPSKDDDSLEVMIDDSIDSEEAYDVGNTLADHNTQLPARGLDKAPSIRVPKGLILPDEDHFDDEFDVDSRPCPRKKQTASQHRKDSTSEGDHVLGGSGNTDLTSKTTSTSLSSAMASTTTAAVESSNDAVVAPPFLTPVLLSFSEAEAAAKAANNAGDAAVNENLDLPNFTPMTPDGPVHNYPRSDPGAQQQQPPSPSLDLPNLFITPIRLRGIRERRSGMQSVGRSNLSWQKDSVLSKKKSPTSLNDVFLIEHPSSTEHDDADDEVDDKEQNSKSNSGGGLASRRKKRRRRPQLHSRPRRKSLGDIVVEATSTSQECSMQSPEFNVEDLDTNRSLPEAVQLPLALRQLAPPSILPSASNLSMERRDNSKEMSPHVQKETGGPQGGKKDLSKLFQGMKLSDMAKNGSSSTDEQQQRQRNNLQSTPLAELVLPALAIDSDQGTENLSSVETTPVTEGGSIQDPSMCLQESMVETCLSPEQDDYLHPASLDDIGEKQLIPELAESRDEDATTPVDGKCREKECCSSNEESEGFETVDVLASILNDKLSPLVEPNKSREVNDCDGHNSTDTSVEGSNIVVNLEASFVESSILEVSRNSGISSLEKSFNLESTGQPVRTTPDSFDAWQAASKQAASVHAPPRKQESTTEDSIVCSETPLPKTEESSALVESSNMLDTLECTTSTFDCKGSFQLHHRRNLTAAAILDTFNVCGAHRRVTSCPDLADPALLGVDEPLTSPMSPSSVEDIKRSAEKRSRLEGAGCMSDMSHSESLAAAMEVFGRLSPPAKRREVEIDEKVSRALAISQQDNHEFLKNYLFCSKQAEQEEEEAIDVTTNRDTVRFCAAEACGPNTENLGDFCASFSTLMNSASSLFPASSSSQQQTGRHLIGLNAGNPYAHAEPDTWFEAATEKFDGAIERWVGGGSNQNHFQNSNFEAPSHAMKTPQSARRKTMAAETPRGSNLALNGSNPQSETSSTRQFSGLRRQPARMHDLTDKQFQLIYGMSREEYEERSASGSRGSLSQNPSWGGSAAPTLSESKSWRSNTGSTSSAPGPPANLQVPRSHSNLSNDQSHGPSTKVCLATPT